MSEIQNIDRALADWFESESQADAAPGVLDSILYVTKRRRPRPTFLAAWGSQWVGEGSTQTRGSVASSKSRIWVAAAAVLIVAVVATYMYVSRPSGVGAPSTPTPAPTPSSTPSTPTPSPTLAPTPGPTPEVGWIYLPHQNEDVIPPGRYQLTGPMSIHPPGWPSRVLVTTPAGWRMTYTERGGGLHTAPTDNLFTIGPDGAGLSGWSVANLYSDPCEGTLADPPLGPSLDDLV